MKRFLLCFTLVALSVWAQSQKTWTGLAGDNLWSTAGNWNPVGTPGSTDDVILDNSNVFTSFLVELPSGNITVSVNSLVIAPASGNTITLLLPNTNTAVNGFIATGAGDAVVLNSGAIFKNSSGSLSAGSPVTVTATNTFRINNGGRYIHNTGRSATDYLISRLSTAVGTEKGVFEFDIPVAGSSAISLQNRIFGSLEFNGASLGGAIKTYSASGTSGDLVVRGDLIIHQKARFQPTLTHNILVAGDFVVNNDGALKWSPSSASVLDGRMIFNGTTLQNFLVVMDSIQPGTDFVGYTVNAGSEVRMLSNWPVGTGDDLIVNGTIDCGIQTVSGAGTFTLNPAGTIRVGSPDGITASAALGNVQTTTRAFDIAANYEYKGTVIQNTGDGLPGLISGNLKINNTASISTSGVSLSGTVQLSGNLSLVAGKLTTTVSNLLILSATAGLSEAITDASFVNGPMDKIGNTNFTFPVGKGTFVHPVAIENGMGESIGNRYRAEYFAANPRSAGCSAGTLGATIDHLSGLEYWRIDNPFGALATKRIRLWATTLSDATARERLVVANCNGSNWVNWGNDNTSLTGAAGPVGSTTTAVLMGNPIFTLASLDPAGINNPLPIQLITFNAQKRSSSQSYIYWELGVCCSPDAKFEIQRSNDAGRSFRTLTTQPGSDTEKKYEYLDNQLAGGVNYYRLKITDAGGSVTFSNTVAIYNGVEGLLLTSLRPTIVTNTTVLTVSASRSQKMELLIIDMSGRVVQRMPQSIQAGTTTITIDGTRVPAGAYQLLGITTDGKTNPVRFVKQ